MALSWLHPQFSAAGTVIAAGSLAYLLGVAPLLGRWKYARLARARRRDAGALGRFYRVSLLVGCAWVAVVALVPVLAPGVRPADLGLAWPAGGGAGYALAATIALLAFLALTGIALRRWVVQGRPIPGQERFLALVPGTGRERRLALAVTVTAGVSEELLCRGLLIAAGVGVLGLPVLAAAAVAVALFGVAHLYQGAGGVLGTALAGAVLTALYLASGSLLLPVVVHIALDARSLLLLPAPSPADPLAGA
jgi:membrane protease YdiL (CAAX protease family)